MFSVSKGTDLQKKKIRTPKRINPLIPLLLTYLVKSNPKNLLFIEARAAKKTEITKDIFDAM